MIRECLGSCHVWLCQIVLEQQLEQERARAEVESQKAITAMKQRVSLILLHDFLCLFIYILVAQLVYASGCTAVQTAKSFKYSEQWAFFSYVISTDYLLTQPSQLDFMYCSRSVSLHFLLYFACRTKS